MSDAIPVGGLEGIDEKASENSVQGEGDGEGSGRGRIGGRERVFDLHRSVALQANLAGKVKRGAFAVERILRETTEGGKSYEERSEFGVIDEFEMERLLFRRSIARNQQC